MSTKCELIKENCIACGVCQVEASDFFDSDEEGIVLFAQEPEAAHLFVDSKQQEAVTRAAKKCPVRAILLEQITA